MIFNNYDQFISNNNISIKKLTTFIHDNRLNISNCHFITPEHKLIFGVIKINNILQDIFNPNGMPINIPNESRIKYDYTIRDGDKLVRTSNDYQGEEFFVNGDTCTVVFTGDPNNFSILYDDGRKETKTITELYEEFILFYCGTIHKSQGCQYENVVLFVCPCSSWAYSGGESKKLLYTGISRAVKRCFVIGDINLFEVAQKNKCKVRNSIFLEEFNDFDI